MSPKAASAWRGDPLPRGRHKLGADEVRASQRERLMRAMLECAAEQGYAATTVPEVVARARVSRNAFYEQFEDKTDCFIAVCDRATNEILAELNELVAEPDWITAVGRGMSIYLRWWQERPAFSRAYFAELPSAGWKAIEQRDRAYERFIELYSALGARARAESKGLPELSPLAPRLAILGITEVIGSEVRQGRIDSLPELEDDLVRFTVRMLADDATADTQLTF